MKLYVVRHGETDGNVNGIMHGHLEADLNEKGRSQAREVGKLIKDNEIDLIISSPLRRTRETAELISNGRFSIIYDKRLRGRNHGEFAGMSKNDVNLADYWNYNKNIQYEKAESVHDIYERAASLIEDVKRLKKRVLLVTHSGICRVLYYYFNGIPKDGDMLTYEACNGLLETYELEEEK